MTTILITGAGRGLGLEFTGQYLTDGDAVIACCRAPAAAKELQALAKAHPGLRIEALDVADDKSISALAAKLKDTAIDILINNAGIYSGVGAGLDDDTSQTFGSIDATGWAKVLQVNTIAPIMVIEAFAPHLQKGADKKIINITSKMGSIAEMGGGSIAYRSSKAALNAAMCVIAHDLREKKITIANVHPGWVQTDMGGKSAPLTPPQSVGAMRQTIAQLKPAHNGQFLNYDGQQISW